MDAFRTNIGSVAIMVLYPDGLAPVRVMAVLRRIHHKLWPAFQFEVSWGNFEHLKDRLVRDVLEAALIKSDILCVATCNRAELPEAAERWLSAIQYSQQHRPLVALLDISHPLPRGSKRPGATPFLEGFASTHQMEFLPYYTADLATHTAQDLVVGAVGQTIQPLSPNRHWRYPAESSSLNAYSL